MKKLLLIISLIVSANLMAMYQTNNSTGEIPTAEYIADGKVPEGSVHRTQKEIDEAQKNQQKYEEQM
ncbi:hypothetical protein M1446_00780 [Candidatus Dependentiae bacterium]|nr:hypothetical protein [Candidatus Dependentiae bacterium]